MRMLKIESNYLLFSTFSMRLVELYEQIWGREELIHEHTFTSEYFWGIIMVRLLWWDRNEKWKSYGLKKFPPENER